MDRITDISEVEQHLDNWDKGWAEQMERIWREKISALRVVDTGALRNSIDHTISGGNDNKTIIHTFLEYGLYQDMGVGKSYKMSHQGAGVGLAFLDEDYRQQHNLGEPRKPRRWFSKKYYASVKVMAEVRTEMLAEDAAILVSNIITSSGEVKDTVFG